MFNAHEPPVLSGKVQPDAFQAIWSKRDSRELQNRRPSKCLWAGPALLLLLDLVVWTGCYLLFSKGPFGSANQFGMNEIIIPAAVLIFSLALVGGYGHRTKLASLKYATEHIIACVISGAVALIFVYLIATFGGGTASSRMVFFLSMTAFMILSLAHRRLLWFALRAYHPFHKLLVVGDAGTSAEFHRAYVANEQEETLEFIATTEEIIGRHVDGPDSPVFLAGAQTLEDILSAHPENSYEGIVIAAAGSQLSPALLQLLTTVHFQDIPVYSVQAFYETYWKKMPVHLLTSTWPLQAGFHLVKHSIFATVKRMLDVVGSLSALLLLSPVVLLIALAVKLDSKGPALFTQPRAGRCRRIFPLFKFRTMTVGSEKKGMYTEENDPRVTRLGRILRAFRLDELPQLFNVLRGDMSLIGPRAEWIKCVEEYERVIPYYHFRHLVRPGITGWAQVNYRYGAGIGDTVEKLMYDLYYIRNFSLILDASVVLKTIYVVVFQKGR